MPFINIKTNVPIAPEAETTIKTALGKAITAVPGKSEGWLMVGLEQQTLYFRGTDEPAAIAQVSLYGSAGHQALDKLAGSITDIISAQLGVSPDRIYVSCFATPDWGWNGSLF
ncbi:MAG: hypothetical protein IJ746_01125 [Ruminococcus sp.]|nr:hypothetical protein [Ruminococcus sp.]